MSADRRYATSGYREATTAQAATRPDQVGTDSGEMSTRVHPPHRRIDAPAPPERSDIVQALDIAQALPPGAWDSSDGSEGQVMPIKVFRVASGYEVVKGHVTYGAGLMLDIEQGETIQIFETPRRAQASRVGTFSYGDLRATKPPRGLTIEG